MFGRARADDDRTRPGHLVAVLQQQLREEGAVLAGDAGNQRPARLTPGRHA